MTTTVLCAAGLLAATCGAAVAVPAMRTAATATSGDPAPGGTFRPLPVRRVLAATLDAGQTRTVQMTGVDGIPAAVSAVVLDITVVAPRAAGRLAVNPEVGEAATGRIMFDAGRTVSHLAVVSPWPDGSVRLRPSATTGVRVDLEGYFTTPQDAGTSGRFVPVRARTLLDTTGGHRVRQDGRRVVHVLGNGIPTQGVVAVLVDLQAPAPAGRGTVSVAAAGSQAARAITMAVGRAQPSTERAIVPVGTHGNLIVTNHAAAQDLAVGVSGYFTGAGGGGSYFVPFQSPRTENLSGSTSSWIPRRTRMRLQVSCLPGDACVSGLIPWMSSVYRPVAALLDAVVRPGRQAGRLMMFRAATATPESSDLRFAAHQVADSVGVVPLSGDGAVAVAWLRTAGRGVPATTLAIRGYFVAAARHPTPAGVYSFGEYSTSNRMLTGSGVTALSYGEAGFSFVRNGVAYYGGRAVPGVPASVVALASVDSRSGAFVIGLTQDGAVWTWDWHTATDGTAARRKPGLHSIVAIGGGARDAYAIDRSGQVWAWGDDSFGQLGDDTSTTGWHATPRLVTGLPAIVSVTGGDMQATAVDATGQVWKWGTDDSGTLSAPHVAVTACAGTMAQDDSDRPSLLCPDGSVWRIGDSTVTRVDGIPPAAAITGSLTQPAVLDRSGRVWISGPYGYAPVGGLYGVSVVGGDAGRFVAAV